MRGRDRAPTGGPGRRLAALVATVLVLQAAACGGGSTPEPVAPVTGPDLTRAELWLSFDSSEPGPGGQPTFANAAGGSERAVVEVADGGQVAVVEGANGRGGAVQFPARCETDPECPRAMVEVESSPDLDPGGEPFVFGARVWLSADQTTHGSNIVQKGRFGTDGGQWKLQVDSDEGHPSCVVRSGTPGAEPVVVRSELVISDSQWHLVTCRRDEDGVTIAVDGTETEEHALTESVANDWPIRIGAPGVGEGDDQFHGRVDDVFLVIGPEA